MAEEKKNLSAADAILAETADLYEDEIDAVAEEVVADVREEEKKAAGKVSGDTVKEKDTPAFVPVPKEKVSEASSSAAAATVSEAASAATATAATAAEVPSAASAPAAAPVPEAGPAFKKSEAVAAIEAKEAAKLERKNEREEKQAAKRNAKRARRQALIDQCPNEYKPVATSTFFWCGVLCYLPVLGVIFTIIFSIFPINKNIKNYARAVLIGYCILLIVTMILCLILFFVTPTATKNEILAAIQKIKGAIKF